MRTDPTAWLVGKGLATSDLVRLGQCFAQALTEPDHREADDLVLVLVVAEDEAIADVDSVGRTRFSCGQIQDIRLVIIVLGERC